MLFKTGSTRLRRVVFGVPPKTWFPLFSAPQGPGWEGGKAVMAGTATTARGTRALPFPLHRSG